jgi:glycosyltransferase involved in cell wall biosynthesis
LNKKVFFQIVDTLSMGGTERMSINLSAVFAEKGWESHLIVSRRGGGLEAQIPDGVIVHFLNKKAFYDVFAFFRLWLLVRELRPILIHAHSTSIYWAVATKWLSSSFFLVWHDHFGLSDQLDVYPRKEMRFFARWIDKILVVNEKLEKYWRKVLPGRDKDVLFVGNFPWLNLKKEEKFETFTFLNLANFRPQKDQLNLIEAVKVLTSSSQTFQVLMVGEWIDHEWGAKIKQEISQSGLETYIQLIGPSTSVESFLVKSHVGILSSESEGLPVALLEYGLASLPVICTQVGDCQKVIPSSEFGWMVSPKDPNRLAEVMLQALVNYPAAMQKGVQLQKRVEHEFGKESFWQAYQTLIPSRI